MADSIRVPGGEHEKNMIDGGDNCPFCRIARGGDKAAVVFEDQETMAFLDIRPVFPGHVLIIPRQHHETLYDLPAPLASHLFANAQVVARAVQQGMEADGTFVGLNNYVSQSVPHVHLHIVPRRWHDGLRGFFWPRQHYVSEDETARVQAAIRKAVEQLRKE